jgi:molybdate transport system substrate-binding protein
MTAPKLLIGIVVALALVAACSAPQPAPSGSEPATLTVFAAASLAQAFAELGALFEAQHPGVEVAFNFAGSQQLAQQLAQGAPGDVFASADAAQMSIAIERGRVRPGAPRDFARNRLVVIYPKDNPAGLVDLRDLARPGLRSRLVLAAAAVPAGAYTLAFLDKASADSRFGAQFKDAVLSNAGSYEENIRAVLSKVVLGEAFAGIVYESDVSGDVANEVGRIEIPDALNVLATYPIASIADGARPDLAQAFVEFVLSPEGQDVLAQHGFLRASD